MIHTRARFVRACLSYVAYYHCWKRAASEKAARLRRAPFSAAPNKRHHQVSFVSAPVAFGAPRKNAAAKAVSWVRDREGLEKRKPADANEVVLVDDEGRLLEGLSSNFYALYDDGTLHTAPEGMVLGGTVRKVVLEVCEREGIEVVLEPPSVNDADRFVAAFVSSTSRLLLPLAKFDIDDKHLQFGDGDGGERARQLEKWVLDEVSRCSSSI